jgi:hypothetical protein
MQKLFDANVDRLLLAGSAANEEFPLPAVPVFSGVEFAQAEFPQRQVELPQNQQCGWNAFEIWHSRIRPGVKGFFQPQT